MPLASPIRAALATATVAAAAIGTTLVGAPPASAAARVTGPLSVAGNALLDNGSPVMLRGVNVEYLDAYPYLAGSPLTDAGIAAMASRGVNFLRVPLSETFTNSSLCSTYRSDYLTTVDSVVSSATSRGIVVDLDLHTNPGAVPCANKQQPLADNGSITFWKTVAARYKGNPLVVFDLYNEPNVSTWSLWLNGGIDNTQSGAGYLVGMQALYNAVRGTGANNVVIASGNGYATQAPPVGSRISGTNIVYGWHTYQCKSTPCTSSPTTVDSGQVTGWDALGSTAPYLMTEFGWADNSSAGASFETNAMSAAEAHGAGWAAYQWAAYSSSNDPFGILTDITTDNPTTTGQPVLDALAS